MPGAPTGVTATADANAPATVTWTRTGEHRRRADHRLHGDLERAGRRTDLSPWTDAGPLTCTVTGLTNGRPTPSRSRPPTRVGTGPASAASTAVTPATVPGAPTGVAATAANTQAMVTWTRPASTGGAVITGYTRGARPARSAP